jgi:hypothetical protein
VTASTPHHSLDTLLEEAFVGRERISRDELQRRAIAADLPADELARVDALPEGEYALDEAAEALRADVDF